MNREISQQSAASQSCVPCERHTRKKRRLSRRAKNRVYGPGRLLVGNAQLSLSHVTAARRSHIQFQLPAVVITAIERRSVDGTARFKLKQRNFSRLSRYNFHFNHQHDAPWKVLFTGRLSLSDIKHFQSSPYAANEGGTGGFASAQKVFAGEANVCS